MGHQMRQGFSSNTYQTASGLTVLGRGKMYMNENHKPICGLTKADLASLVRGYEHPEASLASGAGERTK